MIRVTRPLAAALCLFLAAPALASPPTTLTVQGYLTDSGQAVQGDIDVAVTLYDDPIAGASVGPRQEFGQVQTRAGTFTVEIDGTAAGIGDALWAEIEVRSPAGSGSFTTLSERLALTAAPFAMYALNTPPPPPDPSPPQSSSGLPTGSSFAIVTAPDSGPSARLLGELRVERFITSPPGFPVTGGTLLPIEFELRREWDDRNSLWRDLFEQASSLTIDVDLVVTATNGDRTIWRVTRCTVVGWAIDVADDSGPSERIRLIASSQLQSIVERFNTGPGLAPRPPVLGYDSGNRGSPPADDSMNVLWDGNLLAVSIVDSGPSESRSFTLGGGGGSNVGPPEPDRFSVWRQALHNDILWDDFMFARTRQVEIGVFDFRGAQSASIYEPADNAPGLIAAWTLFLTDDQLPVERVEFVAPSFVSQAGP